MLSRGSSFIRLLSAEYRSRSSSLTKTCFYSKHDDMQSLSRNDSTELLPTENKVPSLANLPSYLPAPTGVKSKLFDEFYLIYRFGFNQPLRYIQLIKLAQTTAT